MQTKLGADCILAVSPQLDKYYLFVNSENKSEWVNKSTSCHVWFNLGTQNTVGVKNTN